MFPVFKIHLAKCIYNPSFFSIFWNNNIVLSLSSLAILCIPVLIENSFCDIPFWSNNSKIRCPTVMPYLPPQRSISLFTDIITQSKFAQPMLTYFFNSLYSCTTIYDYMFILYLFLCSKT